MIQRFLSNSIELAGFVCVIFLAGQRASAQAPLTWEQVQQKFDAANPTLRAGQLNIDEAKAQEITAFLRPNPDMSLSLDQFDPFTPQSLSPVHQPSAGNRASYLYERCISGICARRAPKKRTGHRAIDAGRSAAHADLHAAQRVRADLAAESRARAGQGKSRNTTTNCWR